MIKRDTDLATETEILDRMQSIRRQREALCQGPAGNRVEHHLAFDKRQAKIAKLTSREDALRVRLRDIRRRTA